MSNQVTGRVYVRVDGQLLESKPDATLANVTGVEREEVVGNEVHGYKEKAVAPTIECTISHKAATRLKALGTFTDGSVTFECDTGTVYVLKGAWLANSPGVKDGETELKFAGQKCEEVT